MFATLIVFIFSLFSTFSLMTFNIQAAYNPPANNRVKFNFDYDWKFIKQDIAGAEGVHLMIRLGKMSASPYIQ